MASVRKRILPSGKVSWLVTYRDPGGARRSRQFAGKAQAVEFETRARAEIAAGTHVADRASITVREAADLWIRRAERENLETATVRQYRQHVKFHVVPLIGDARLSRLTTPVVEKFRDDLLQKCASRALARAVLASFKGILKEARRRGLLGHDPAATTAIKFAKDENRKRGIPSKDQIRAILTGAEVWPYTKVQITRSKEAKTVTIAWRPFLVTAIFTGMRCSELRGLTWNNVDFEQRLIKVCQRADFQNIIGTTKSRAGDRDIPMSPMVFNTLREWRLACPNWPKNLVFPTEKGTVHSNGNLHHYCWGPLLRKLGFVKQVGIDKNSLPIIQPSLTFHSLRHAAASLFIEHGMTPKKVQVVMGHSSISVTFDIYGHLWKDTKSDADEMALVEARLLA